MILPIDLSLAKTADLLVKLEECINHIWDCKYESDKIFLLKDESLRIITELSKRERRWRLFIHSKKHLEGKDGV